MNPLSVHWIPAHRGTIGGKTDAQWLAAWQPAFVKIVTDNETVPYLEDVPPDAMIVVRNYPLSELGHDRGFGVARGIDGEPAIYQGQTGTPRDVRVSGPGAFRDPNANNLMRGVLSIPEHVGIEHAAICNRIATWCEGRGVPRSRLLFEGLNEPMLWSVEPPAQVARYYRQFLISLHGYNLRGVAGNFGVGWPGNGGVQDAPVQWSFWQPVVDVMETGERPDYLGLHEYWALNGVAENWRWWAGRYEQCPFNIPILITETGIDTGVTGHYYGGWLDLPGQMTERATRYVGELAWYWQKCRADGRIKAIFPFTYDRGSDTWVNFDIRNEDMLREIVARTAEFPAPAAHVFGGGGPVPDEPDEPEQVVFQPFLLHPVRGAARVSQRFGATAIDYSRFGLIGHNGLDLAGATGTPIVAAHDGMCWVYDDPDGYGRTVEVWAPRIMGGAEYKTIYAHLSKWAVSHKQVVRAGDVIGYLGSTGNSTGPHLHFGLKWLTRAGVAARNTGYRDWVDPWPFMRG